MSIFMNQKEEVIQLELTAYGKHLFSKGEFLPAYYAFYDGDILYDGEYGGIQESQSDISYRIKNTPRLSVQSNYTSSVNTNEVVADRKGKGTDGEWLGLRSEAVSSGEFDSLTYSSVEFLRPIGTAARWSDFAPAWNITTTSGSVLFSGSASYKSLEAVPTITGSVVTSYLRSETPQGQDEAPLVEYLIIDQGVIRLDIQELHSVFKAEGNFDIEIFRQPLDNHGESDGDLQRLRFIDPMSTEAEALYSQQETQVFASTLDRGDSNLENDFPLLDSTYTEFFLSVRVDDEIQDGTVLPGVSNYSAGTGNLVDDSCAPNLPRGGGN